MKNARHHRRQRGISGMLVIAALVLFGGMAVYGVSTVTSVHTQFAQEVASARAMQAAQAGLDWARYQVKIPVAANCPASQTLVLPSTLAMYQVTVTCTSSALLTDGAATFRMYQLTATACNIPGAGGCPNAAGGNDYVEKQVSTWVQR
jgi:MSHA biogenesis protein MshP